MTETANLRAIARAFDVDEGDYLARCSIAEQRAARRRLIRDEIRDCITDGARKGIPQDVIDDKVAELRRLAR